MIFINSRNVVVNIFNKFFVDVGPNLAAKIANVEIYNCDLIDTNPKTLFLNPVEENEILDWKVFNSRLDSFIEKNHILSDNQFGFRNNRSTLHALFDIIEEITNAVDNKKYAIGLFIDLSKAFDTINYDILINKLEQYGISGLLVI